MRVKWTRHTYRHTRRERRYTFTLDNPHWDIRHPYVWTSEPTGVTSQYLEANLVRSVRKNGKPRQEVVAYLGVVHPGNTSSMGVRCYFWERVDKKLASLDLDSVTLEMVRFELATWIMPPTDAERAAHDAEIAALFAGDPFRRIGG